MTPARYRLLHQFISSVLLCAMLITLVAPVTDFNVLRADDTPEEAVEPAPQPEETFTEEPTIVPEVTEEPEATVEVTEEPAAEVTEEITEEPEIPTEQPTEAPTQAPVTDYFEADFESGSTAGWLLSPGWQLVTEDGNTFLSAATPGETATIADVDWAHFLLAAYLRIDPENEASIAIRAGVENYTITLSAAGQASLYRAGELLAQGAAPTPLPDDEEPIAVWHRLNIQAIGGLLTVAVDGVVQFSYTDPAPLGAGMIVFSTGAQNTGAVGVDDVAVTKLDEPAEAPEPIITETPETTEEPETEATEEPGDESTEQPPATGPIFITTFEGEITGWALSEGAEIIAVSDTNNALLLTVGSSLTPSSPLYMADFRVEALFSLLDSGNLEFAFRVQEANSYLLTISSSEIALYHTGTDAPVLIASAEAAYELEAWHSLNITAQGADITVLVDNSEVLAVSDDTSTASGSIAFTASGDVLLDNIVVIDLTPAVFVEPTALPPLLTEDDRAKLQDVIYEVLDLYLNGEQTAALTLAEDYFMPVLDDQHRISVVVHANSGETGESITPIVEAAGGIVEFTRSYNVEAQIPLATITDVIASDAVFSVVLPDRATSTSALEAPAEAGAGGVVPHSLDMIGVNDWYEANIRGNGVNIAVIDTSFAGVNTGNANFSCFNGSPPAGSSHGAMVVQVLCDVAPNSTVRGLTATTEAQLITAINTARTSNNNRVILITLDLGVHISPGDGTDGSASWENPPANSSVYGAIKAARDAGILVIVSAGNNNDNSYVSWTYGGAATDFTIQAQAGDTVSLSWNDWDRNPNNGGAREDFTLDVLSSTLGDTTARPPAGRPSRQVTFNSAGTFTIRVTRTAGNSASDYLQLQTTGRITGYPGGLSGNTSSTMGRPGDSIHALSVGAVCASQEGGYPILADSSRGPLYAAGGGQPPAIPGNVRTSVKPNLVGPSHVSVMGNPITTNCAGLGTDGFNGTSAAAAHVAGMAALLISNTNASMNAFDSGNGAANALQNYMQNHAVGLVGSRSNNGFDNIYGAGLTVLGNPNYNLGQVSAPPALTGLPGTTYYVGGRGLGANNNPPQSGTHSEPFVSLALAIDTAQPGDSIVLFPGEYVTGLEIAKDNIGIYAYNSIGAGNNSVFWVNNSAQGEAGLYVTGDNVIISGFNFIPANPLGLSDCCGEVFARSSAVEFANVSGGELRNSTFAGYTNRTEAIVAVFNSTGVLIENNTLQNINGGSVFGAALKITDSESANSSSPIVVRGNRFSGNFTTKILQDIDLEAIVNVENSAVDFVANLFFNNNSESVVRINNTNNPGAPAGGAVGTMMVNFYSNVFMNNLEGPVIYIRLGRRVRFINNTVVNNTLTNNSTSIPHRAVITRNNPPAEEFGTWSPTVAGFDPDSNWDVHNNIFYNNSHARIIDDRGAASECRPLGSSTDQSGATHNWIVNSGAVTSEFGAGGVCAQSIASAPGVTTNNNLNVAIVNDFVGTNPASGLELTDPNYYRLIDGSIGIDAASAAVPNADVDFTNINPRVVDGGPDIGAFELVPLTALPITTNRSEDTFTGLGDVLATATVNGAFAINLEQGVVGGFAPYTFSITGYPQNYSTDVDDACGGLGVVVQGNTALYCPPRHFYTINGLAEVVFSYRVSDRFGTSENAVSTVTVNIAPVADTPLGPSAAVDYSYITEINKTFGFRLRPFVRFNNFRFSESRDPVRGNMADYPFSYGSVTVLTQPGDNPLLFGSSRAESQTYLQTQVAAAGPDGLITLTPQPGELGFIAFTYQVTDNNGGTVTNTIRLEVVGIIPDRGLHDDTSLSFKYTNGWLPLYSEGNINNTLHQAQNANQRAEFTFVGEAFTLYMQADQRGANWQLRVNEQLLSWTRNPATGESRASADTFTCSTFAPTNGTLIDNFDRTRPLYTVNCRGLRDGESNVFEVIHQDNRTRRFLNIDAVSIGFDDDPLYPRFHEVNERNVLPFFPNWTLFNHNQASNRIALSTTATGEVSFSFSGTGIAIGTALEPNGAQYNICITPEGGTEFCHSFDNTFNAPRRGITWRAYRPFFGFDPAGTHRVRLVITSIPAGGRMVIDDITVFDETPSGPLPFGTTQADNVGPIVFSNGLDDSWVLDTRRRQASNESLQSIAPRTNNIGPFISFQIPADSNRVLWQRLSGGRRDSSIVRICVDRAQGENASNHCISVDLTTAPNPFLISEAAFPGGWGDGFGPDNTHTIEIFSLENKPFNLDSITVLGTTQPFYPSFYEEYLIDGGGNNRYGYFLPNNNLGGGNNFSNVNDRRASGGSVKRTTTNGAGIFFQIEGTGFAPYFTTPPNGGNVEICWVPGHTNNIATIRAGTCRTYFNQSGRIAHQVARAFTGLSDTVQPFSVTVRKQSGDVMDFDAFEVFGDMPGTPLTADRQRYPTSYDRRRADDLFLYYGSGWRTRNNANAAGGTLDELLRVTGGGIVFNTDGVDTVEIVRTPGRRNAWIEVCVDGANCRTFAGDATPVVVYLPNTNPHQVSVTTLNADRFILDAVDVYNSTNPITPGFYEDTYPLLKFDAVWETAVSARNFTGRTARQTSVNGASMIFHMYGNAFQVGALANQANQMSVCYVPGIVTNPNNVDQNCQNWPPTPTSDVQTYTRSIGGDSAIYTVRVRNTAASVLAVDWVNIFNTTGALVEGFYEETYPVVDNALAGNWTPIFNNRYSGRSAVQTFDANASLVFEFEGTGFAIGTARERNAGDMLVCYEQGALSSFGTPAEIDANCYTYNNNGQPSYTFSRSVNGLADNTYSVRVVNLTAGAPLTLDYVEIFNDTPPVIPVGSAGMYNEDAGPGTGYLSLQPANRWGTISGRTARNFTGSSYFTVVDDRGRASNRYAGPVATMRVEVPAQQGGQPGRISIILDTGPTTNRNSTDLLICVQNVNGSPGTCQVSNMRTIRYHTVNLTNNTGAVVTRSVTFRTLTPGSFNIDGFQIIENRILGQGIYDDPLMSAGGIIDLGGAWILPPNRITRDNRAYGGSVVASQTLGATINFDFVGTGFSIITQQNNRGVNFQLCYVPADEFTTWNAGNITCVSRTNNIQRGRIDQHGHSIYGLAPDHYKVRLRVNDNSIGLRDYLLVDAIAVFGDVTAAAPLERGMYDDADLVNRYGDAVRFAPEVFWSSAVTRQGPPRGPWQQTEQVTTNVGAIMQVLVDGNALTIYQTVERRNSSVVQVCLVVQGIDGNELECNTFSQNTNRRTFFTPIVIYGLGAGQHEVIFENRDNRRFNVDALRVIP